jgi:galactose mutarotase-like enzyme
LKKGAGFDSCFNLRGRGLHCPGSEGTWRRTQERWVHSWPSSWRKGKRMKARSGRTIALIGFCAAAHLALAQHRYTVTDEDASGPGSPRLVVLRDTTAGAEAAVAPSEGGELSSYKVKFKGQTIELLYHARDYSSDSGFKGKAPLLWPAVGAQFPLGTLPKESCGDGTYRISGKIYPMPCHGFARSVQWREVHRSADSRGARVTVELTDSELTRKSYPFAFHLDATFTLVKGHLAVEYAVKSGASNREPMIFSIGNHIAFKIPFVQGTDPAKMLFETQSSAQLLRNSVGVLSGGQIPRSFATPQNLDSFDAHEALPLTGYRGQPFARLIDPQGLTLLLTQWASSTLPEPLVRFNVLAGPKLAFFCPEPFFGVQNSFNTREGLIELKPGGLWKWRFVLQVEDVPKHASPGSAM